MATMATAEQTVNVTIKIGPIEHDYVLIRTNAPARYDAGGSLEVHDSSHTPKDGTPIIERYVLIPTDQLAWQRGRNSSGLRSTVTDPEELLIDARDVATTIWRRLFGEEVR